MAKQKEQNIRFRILNIKKLSSFENNLFDFGLTEKDIVSGKLKITVQLNIDDRQNIIEIRIGIIFYVLKNEKEIELFGGNTLHTFEVKNFSTYLKKGNDNKYVLQDDLLLAMLNISIGGTRGILSVSKTNHAYRNIFVPVLKPSEIKKLIVVTEKSNN